MEHGMEHGRLGLTKIPDKEDLRWSDVASLSSEGIDDGGVMGSICFDVDEHDIDCLLADEPYALHDDAPPNVEMDDVDQLVAEEMNKLTLGEREKVLHDLHGVLDADYLREPSEKTRKQRLQEMQDAILTQVENRGAYDLAHRMDPEYVQQDEFRCLFLRADEWDPCQAAERLVRFFETKLELFGSELLCKDITQDDLDPASLEVLYSGYSMELPLRDMSDRHVSLLFPDPVSTTKSKLRRLFYGNMVRVRDLETQIKGVVNIFWVPDLRTRLSRKNAWEIGRMLKSLPIKIRGCHICLVDNGEQSLWTKSVIAVARFSVETVLRLRIKTHSGTPHELKLALQAYGIPASLIPITDEGNLLKENDKDRWSKRRMEERQELHQNWDASFLLSGSIKTLGVLPPNRVYPVDHVSPPPVLPSNRVHPVDNPYFPHQEISIFASIDGRNSKGSDSVEKERRRQIPEEAPLPGHSPRVGTPCNTDVLLGRGRLSQRHVGNIRLRTLIERHQKTYDNSTRVEKTMMAASLVGMVKARNGRFLKVDGSGWTEAEDIIARTKVANCFRTTRHRKKVEANDV